MEGRSEEETESLLLSFDSIYKGYEAAIAEIHVLKSSFNAEVKRREALEITCNSLKIDNERLTKAYAESLTKFTNQLKRHTKCENFMEELRKENKKHLSKESEHMKTVEMLKQEHAMKIEDLEKQVRGYLLQQAEDETRINHLQRDLTAHKTQINILMTNLEKVAGDVELKYHHMMEDLKDSLLVEQEQKNELYRKNQNMENELLINKAKQAEQQLESTLNRHIETLKQKIMKLRKENEVLKRHLLVSRLE